MRASWEALRSSLEKSVSTPKSLSRFDQMKAATDLEAFESPGQLVAFLTDSAVALAEKDPLYRELVAAAQSHTSHGPLAQNLLLLGLSPGLGAVCARARRRFPEHAADVVNEVVDRALDRAQRVDLARVRALPTTIVANVERDLVQAFVRDRLAASRSDDVPLLDELGELGVVEQPAPLPPSAFGLPPELSDEAETAALRAQLRRVLGESDAGLVVDFVVLRVPHAVLARNRRISPVAARQRLSRSLRALRELLSESDAFELAPQPPRSHQAPSPAFPRRAPVRSGETNHQEQPMTTNMWEQTEDLAKKHDQGSSTWLKLANDGDKAVVVFLGQPFPREVCFVEGKYLPYDDKLKTEGHKASLRVAFNVALFDTKEVKVLEQGVVFFKDLLQVREKYGLEKWAFEIRRNGAAKDPKTTYSILPEHQLSPAQLQEFQKLTLHDLEAVYQGSGSGGGGEDAKPGTIDEKTAQSITVVLKSLPKEAVERFCKKLGVARIREISVAQQRLAIDVLDALEAEFKPKAAEVDPFA